MRHLVVSIAALFLIWISPPSVLDAQSAPPESPETPAPTATPGLAVSTDGVVELSLDQALEITLRQSLRLRIERLFDRETRLGIIEQQGIFDVVLDSNLGANESILPPTSTLEATGGAPLSNESISAGVGAAALLPSGTGLRLDLGNSRSETNNQNASLIPQYDASARLALSQPLLRGFGRATTARNLLIAKTDAAISYEQLQLRVEEVLQQVADAYWNLVAAREQLEVAQESLRLAGELHRSNGIQVEVGTMAQIELVQSQAGVAQREEDTIQFSALVEDQQDFLRELLSFDVGPLWDAELVPTSEPAASFVEIDVTAAIRQALAQRPEVLSQKLTLENRRLDEKVERRLRLPQLDLTASYQYSGVGGTANDADLILEREGNAGAIRQVLDGQFDGWSAGLLLSYPLRNRTARARHARSELALERGQLELEELYRSLRSQVRRAARAVLTAQQRISSAQQASELTRRNLEAEQKRYENGLSSSFTLLRIQEDLAGARQREVFAVTNYRRQLVAFQRAKGTLLEELGIEIEVPSPTL